MFEKCGEKLKKIRYFREWARGKIAHLLKILGKIFVGNWLKRRIFYMVISQSLNNPPADILATLVVDSDKIPSWTAREMRESLCTSPTRDPSNAIFNVFWRKDWSILESCACSIFWSCSLGNEGKRSSEPLPGGALRKRSEQNDKRKKNDQIKWKRTIEEI